MKQLQLNDGESGRGLSTSIVHIVLHSGTVRSHGLSDLLPGTPVSDGAFPSAGEVAGPILSQLGISFHLC